jgi:hypothetical protein
MVLVGGIREPENLDLLGWSDDRGSELVDDRRCQV